MTMTDPIADLLTRIRNVNSLGRKRVKAPYSKTKEQILAVLKKEGFIEDYNSAGEIPNKGLEIQLKYGPEGELVIRRLERVSKPGRRVYRKVKELRPVLQGLGIALLSTPRGIMSDHEAKKHNVGGEVLCNVW